MAENFTTAELEAYLDEALPSPRMAEVERALRDDAGLVEHLARVCARRDAGAHSLGAIWRRHTLSCPTRDELGRCLLGVEGDDAVAYARFHVEVICCRRCQANLADLRARQVEEPAAAETRRRKFFQSSAGHLKRV